MLIQDENEIVIWDGADWVEEPEVDFVYLVAKAAKEFGWTVDQIFDLTMAQLVALLEKVSILNYENAYYTAVAYHDPKRISSEIEELHCASLSDEDRWKRAVRQGKNMAGKGVKREV